MKEINELNSRLLNEVGERFATHDKALYFRRNEVEDIIQLPPALQTELEAVRSEIHKAVPNDFNYTICLGFEYPCFTIEYEDGPQSQFFRSHDWEDDKSLIEQLNAYDWDGERQDAISGSQIFDGIRELAPDMPSNLPSTKQLQKEFKEEMKDFVKTMRKDASKVHVMLFRREEGLHLESFDSLELFSRELPDMMTVQILVVAVVANGKPLPAEKLELLKRVAIADLDDMPISQAKALHKFPFAGAGFGPNPEEMMAAAFEKYHEDVPSVGSVTREAAEQHLADGKICRGSTVVDGVQLFFHIIKSPLKFPNKAMFMANSEEELFDATVKSGQEAEIPLYDLFGVPAPR